MTQPCVFYCFDLKTSATFSTTESVATMIAEAIAKAIGIAKLWNDA